MTQEQITKNIEEIVKNYQTSLETNEKEINNLNHRLEELEAARTDIPASAYEKDLGRLNELISTLTSQNETLIHNLSTVANIENSIVELENLKNNIDINSTAVSEPVKQINEQIEQNIANLPTEVQPLFKDYTQKELEQLLETVQNRGLKTLEDYQNDLTTNKIELANLAGQLQQLEQFKSQLPKEEYQRELDNIKTYMNRERGKSLRNQQVITSYELVKNNQERLNYLDTLTLRDNQDRNDINKERQFLEQEINNAMRFIPQNIRKELNSLNKENKQHTTKILNQANNSPVQENNSPTQDNTSEVIHVTPSPEDIIDPPAQERISTPDESDMNEKKNVIPTPEQELWKQLNESINKGINNMKGTSSHSTTSSNNSLSQSREEILLKQKSDYLKERKKLFKEFTEMAKEPGEKVNIMYKGNPYEVPKIKKDYVLTILLPKISQYNKKLNQIRKELDELHGKIPNQQQNSSKENNSSSKNSASTTDNTTSSPTDINNNQNNPQENAIPLEQEPPLENIEEEIAKEDTPKKKNKLHSAIKRTRKPKINIKVRLIKGIAIVAAALVIIGIGSNLSKSSNKSSNIYPTADTITETTSEELPIEYYDDEEVSEDEQNIEYLDETTTLTTDETTSNSQDLIEYFDEDTLTQDSTTNSDTQGVIEYLDADTNIANDTYTEGYTTTNLTNSNEDLIDIETTTADLTTEPTESEQTNQIRIGSTIDVGEANIYTNLQNSYFEENPHTQYYKNNPSRIVLSVAIENNGTITNINATTPNANAEIDRLINEGGQIVSVLTANKDKYLADYDGSHQLTNDEIKAYAEGWYNVNSLNQNTKGIVR